SNSFSPRPLLSKLFPYTTLFRSVSFAAKVVDARCSWGTDGSDGDNTDEDDEDTRPRGPFALTGPAMDQESCRHYHRQSIPSTGLDRKSTRLNSSHSQISYAVFCL